MMNGLKTVMHGQKIFCRVNKNIKKLNLETLNENSYSLFGWRWMKAVICKKVLVICNGFYNK